MEVLWSVASHMWVPKGNKGEHVPNFGRISSCRRHMQSFLAELSHSNACASSPHYGRSLAGVSRFCHGELSSGTRHRKYWYIERDIPYKKNNNARQFAIQWVTLITITTVHLTTETVFSTAIIITVIPWWWSCDILNLILFQTPEWWVLRRSTSTSFAWEMNQTIRHIKKKFILSWLQKHRGTRYQDPSHVG